MRHRWRLAILGIAALLVASCTVSTDGDPSPHRPVPDPTAAPLSISDAPVFASNDLAVHPVESVQLAGDDTAIITAVDTGVLVAVSLATGQQLWQLDRHAPLPGDAVAVFHNGPVIATAAGVVIVPYVQRQCQQQTCAEGEIAPVDESGYAALSAADGSLLWKFPTVSGVPADSAEYDYVSGLVNVWASADQNVLIATVRQLAASVTGPGKPAVFSVGIDAATGTELWRADDFGVLRIAGAVAYGTIADTVDEYVVGNSVPAALDALTGQLIWQLTDAEAGRAFAGFGSDGTLMVPKPPTANPLYLYTAGGTELGVPGTDLRFGCPQLAHPGRLACSLEHLNTGASSRILTIGDGVPLISEAPIPRQATVSYVDETYIYLNEPADSGDSSSYAADVHGTKLSRDFPGKVVATNAKYVVVLRDDSQVGGSVSVAAYSRT